MNNGSVNEHITSLADSEIQTECRLLSCTLFGTDFNFADECDWSKVYEDLIAQAVEGIVGDYIPKLPVSADMRIQWKKSCINRIGNFYRLLSVQNELTELLRKEKINFVILKGTAAAMYYPRPQYRAMGDIDFLVAPADFDRAFELLTANGFSDTDESCERHKNLIKNNCEFEMHKYFTLRGESKELAELDKVIFDGLNNAEFHEIDGAVFPALPKLQNGLVLLQHLKHHLRRHFGMRQIIDWMLFVDKNLDDEYWNTEFSQYAAEAELVQLAVTVTRMCQIYFGLREDITWCADADEKLCEQLFRHIYECGNMGKNRTDRVQKTFDLKGGPFALVKNLQFHGVRDWKALKKFPFLRPFAWLYQICHHIRIAFKYKITPSKIISYSKTENEHIEMYKKLGCPDDFVGE